MLDSPTALAQLPQAARYAPSAADLSEVIIKALRQRGLKGGSILVFASGAGTPRNLDHRPEFQFTGGTLENAATLLGDGQFAGVAVVAPRTAALDQVLAAVAARLPADTPLVLILPRVQGDLREAVHLLLLRSGYDRVWVDSQAGVICASARRARPVAIRTCSIIVPVFNEKDTFPALMQAVLDKRLDHLGLEREIVIVESNSTDGSRELVAAHAATPGVRILWQDRPRGKGNAVRAGLQAATGDIVLIQDADLEYDVKDYDALLEPLLQEQAAFVLGSRHSGRSGMRQFTEQRWIGTLFNFGHVCFTGLINILYGQKLRDPFTMYKVFRRDCLHGLQLECNRFDFDHELVIKLVLKGYRPLEIPVSYRSRSFKQGKKIRPLRDALTWIAADVRYRLRPLRPHLD